MKILIFFSIAFLIARSPTIAQVDTTAISNNFKVNASSVFLKSKKQKTTAWVLLAGGGVLTATGIIVTSREVDKSISNLFNPNYTSSNSNTGDILGYSGAAIMLGSIPLFIASGKNGRKANLMIKNETVFLNPQLSLTHIISFGVKVNL